jgi:hypothetical protein
MMINSQRKRGTEFSDIKMHSHSNRQPDCDFLVLLHSIGKPDSRLKTEISENLKTTMRTIAANY